MKLNSIIKRISNNDGEKWQETVKAYNESRFIEPTYLCHAPFNNMYFNTYGHVAVCWKTFDKPVKYSEKKTLKDIWNSGKFRRLRQHIKDNDLHYRCRTCEKHLKNGNFVNVLARAYDKEFELTEWPSILEFELENTCNLGCTMCTGMLSSVIRKDVDKLPPLVTPYGDKFIRELREFMPHLKEARFNGGEALLIKMNYQIFDMAFELNPGLRMILATNGTVLTSKVKDYLERGNFHLNISMDGFSKEIYESIRLKGNFDRLMENFVWFKDYCLDNDRSLCVMVNPMRQNWWEMIDSFKFCNENSAFLCYNTIIDPKDHSLWALPSQKLQEIYDTLSAFPIPEQGDIPIEVYNHNVRSFNNLVHQQIKTWQSEAEERERPLLKRWLNKSE